MKTTKAQVSLMSRAYYLRVNHGADGVFPLCGSQRAALVRLEDAGLMRFTGFGRDIDGERDGDVPIWEITPAGEAALVEAGEIDASRKP